ncbi:quinoprotein relay system zinc metallohydrolase 1 [Sedimentitalea sp. JM2-8]|uniref:Quinoprotein relay system zinc metallohydrolase 1 n=1 Tax=Sedimentitalea xiamensis TaxID=3050037 RepID=A0ABT7FD98_9RHOB|nr:quinoprotein relay system zinc metallohydrolase 1 [Sedimentitalea xiamensis]MDK3073091.1 quinoprotein relay system zinc metallohydrolase 1 [Sedimentitalea xiamensis]
MITRRHALCLIGSGAASLPGLSHAQARLTYELTPKPVAQGVWMIEGSTDYFTMENGGAIVNCVLLQGDSGLIVVDTGPSLRFGEALHRLARTLDIRGVSEVVNTHHHPDHFFGNQVFAGQPIRALGETIGLAQAEGDGFADNMYRLLGDWMRGTEVTPPRNVIEGGDTTIDGRALTILPLSGHTGADMAILDQSTGILIAGDLVFFNRAPTTPSADLAQWQSSLGTLAALRPAAVLPGHGPLDPSGDAIRQTSAYLDWLADTLTRSAENGLDMIEVMQSPLPKRFAAMGAQPQEFQRSVSHLFPDVELSVLPRGN